MAYDGREFRGPNDVNVAEILRVADLISASPSFNMSRWVHDCGTPACIAGHLVGTRVRKRVALLQAEDDAAGIEYMIAKAAPLLAISEEVARHLFMPWTLFRSLSSPEISAEWAAACLRKLAETGEVDWLGTKPATGQ
jgi:hypothetical protein